MKFLANQTKPHLHLCLCRQAGLSADEADFPYQGEEIIPVEKLQLAPSR
jgi:hypothetical protein